jgi:hypothetical protein
MIVKVDTFCFASRARPTKHKPPLLVDPNGMKSREIATQFLKMIAWRHPQILIGRGIVEHLKPAKQPAFQIGRDASRFDVFDEESPQPGVTKIYDHGQPASMS